MTTRPPVPIVRDLIFLDLETSGLHHRKHEILEIAAVRVRVDGFVGFVPSPVRHWTELASFETRVKPYQAVPREAADLNGYTPEKWQDAVKLDDALDMLEGKIVAPFRHDPPPVLAPTLVGNNVGAFDLAFLREAYDFTQKPIPFDYHTIDLAVLAWPLYLAGLIPGLKLRHICEYFGISNENEHRAMADVRRSMAICTALLARA